MMPVLKEEKTPNPSPVNTLNKDDVATVAAAAFVSAAEGMDDVEEQDVTDLKQDMAAVQSTVQIGE